MSCTMQHVSWTAPTAYWVCINTDGAGAGCGGLLLGSQGEWLGGFAKYLGSSSAFIAELWGAFEGLNLARRKGFPRLELQLDSSPVVSILKGDAIVNHAALNYIHKIRALLSQDWDVRIKHVIRKANKCANFLANMGCELDSEFVDFVSSPSLI